MYDLKEMLKRAEWKNIISYLICGRDSDMEIEDVKDMNKKIEDSYEIIFERLEEMYSGANRHDDNLYKTVTEFAMVHDNIFFETGVLAGIQLYRDIDREYNLHSGNENN